MARLFGKPINKANGFPWMGTVTLLKDSTIRMLSNGKKQWSGFGSFEKSEKGDRTGKTAISMTTGLNDQLARCLIAWPKGTVLFVVGELQLSDYWTQRNGRDSYELSVQFVHDQHDYNAASEPVADDAPGAAQYSGRYVDAGF